MSNISSNPFAEKMRQIKEESKDFNFYHEVDWNKLHLLEKEFDEEYDFIYWIDVGISHRGLFLLKYNPFADKITGLSKDWENYSFIRLFNSDLFPRINKWLGETLINISHTQIRSNFEQINEIYNSNHHFESNTVGGILGGHTSKMKWFVDDFKRNGTLCLDQKIILNHEQIISYMVKEYSHYFSTYIFDSWYHEDWRFPKN